MILRWSDKIDMERGPYMKEKINIGIPKSDGNRVKRNMRMQKRVKIIALVLALLITMTGCRGEKKSTVLREISKEVGVDVSAGEVIAKSDTHGGFHGDGHTVVEIQFVDTSLTALIEANQDWNAFPLTENLTRLVYGLHTEYSSIGPTIHSGNNVPVVPEIENGYFYFRDRHFQSTDPKDDTNVFSRFSYNFTMAIYDAETNTLYYMELDT